MKKTYMLFENNQFVLSTNNPTSSQLANYEVKLIDGEIDLRCRYWLDPAGEIVKEEVAETPLVPIKTWTAEEFYKAFTVEERKKIRALAKINSDVEDATGLLSVKKVVTASSPVLQGYLSLLVAENAMTQLRVDDIVGN